MSPLASSAPRQATATTYTLIHGVHIEVKNDILEHLSLAINSHILFSYLLIKLNLQN